jgi:ribosomal protein S18 acetylase RimI-like enzyme
VPIERVTQVDDELVAAFARLIPQLSQRSAPGASELDAITRAQGTTLLIAREGRSIVGTAILHIYRIPTGLQARIDDVVVQLASRGRGLGEALVREAITIARAAGAKALHLTSHPRREAANRLYLRLGFEERDASTFSLKLGT